jgi:anti-sigma B factor antagonist
MRMQVAQVGPSVITVNLDGRFDGAGVADVEAEMSAVAAVNNGVVVDLSGVSFLASAGLRLLLHTARIVQRRGGRLVLLDPLRDVRQVLEVTGVTDLLPVHNDRCQALLAVSQEHKLR